MLNWTLAETRDALAQKKTSAKELAQAYLTAIDKLNPEMNAYVTMAPEVTLKMAEASDARRAKGQVGKLEGVPIAVKDLFCTTGVRTTACSNILKNFVPPYESTITERLWNDGAVMLGKTNLDEFAMGSGNLTSALGTVKSPWKRKGDDKTDLVPGGSSGGSAAAVSARLAPASLGTDTGGSIRQPASFCGITGIKPTYGRCSRFGIIAFASSLDQAGPFARTVKDCAIMLNSMCGHDPKDSTSSPEKTPDFEKAITGNIKGLRIGIPKEYRVSGMDKEIEALWNKGAEWLKAQGAEVVDVTLPHTQYALATYYILAPAECSSNLARYDGIRYGVRVAGDKLEDLYELTRAAGFGHEVKRRILIGTYVLSAGYYDAYYKKAQRVRSLIAQDFNKAFEKCDAILTPTAPTPAFAIGEKFDDPVTMYLNDVFTVPTSLAGLPGISVPAGLSATGLPLGLQLIGKAFDEATILNVASAIETAANFTAKPGKVAA